MEGRIELYLVQLEQKLCFMDYVFNDAQTKV